MKKNFIGKDIISIKDFSKNELLKIIEIAQKLKEYPTKNILSNYTLGSCFFEPSTRTRLSFETAMLKLGGKVVGFSDSEMTSTTKGETLEDTIKIVSQYVDIITIRHPMIGSAELAATASEKPVINCGDGAGEHPTQTFVDLFTIKECQGKLENLKIAIVGDLKYGRTVHSLSQALSHFDVEIFFVSPELLQIPQYICDHLEENNIKFSSHTDIENIIDDLDIIYMTRVQSERFTKKEEYEKVKNVYSLDLKLLKHAKENLKILHPLPRVNEINRELDQTKYAYFFQQAANGIFIRQAVLSILLGELI